MLGAALVILAAACQVRTDVAVRVDRDGSGTVSVAVNLDREAAAQIPDLAAQLRTADLRRAGWRLDGPNATSDGGLRVAASKRFGRPSAAGAVLAELTGKTGPLSRFTVRRSHSFARTKWEARGTVDLRNGLAAFRDDRLTLLLGGRPFGRSEQELVRLAHGSLADAAPFRITVRVPDAGARTFLVRLGDRPLPIDAVSSETNSSAYLLGGAAVVALLAAIGLWVAGGRTRRRQPRSQRGMGAYRRPRFETITETEGGPPPGTGGTPQLVRVQRPPPQPRRAPSAGRGPQRRAEGRAPQRPGGRPPPQRPGGRPAPRRRRPPDR